MDRATELQHSGSEGKNRLNGLMTERSTVTALGPANRLPFFYIYKSKLDQTFL